MGEASDEIRQDATAVDEDIKSKYSNSGTHVLYEICQLSCSIYFLFGFIMAATPLAILFYRCHLDLFFAA